MACETTGTRREGVFQLGTYAVRGLVTNGQTVAANALPAVVVLPQRRSFSDCAVHDRSESVPAMKSLLPTVVGLLLALVSLGRAAGPTEPSVLNWDLQKNVVTADVDGVALTNFLSRLATVTGWEIAYDPGISYKVSAKFREQGHEKALRMLLGQLNYSVTPISNNRPLLTVYRTDIKEATVRIAPELKPVPKRSSRIPNELVVTLKPGEKIEDIARLLGAKVIGRAEGLDSYRLQFPDEAAATAAKTSLEQNPAVASVDANYFVNRPTEAQQLALGSAPGLNLKIKPPSDSGRMIVGLVDTAIQAFGDSRDQFLLPAVHAVTGGESDQASITHSTAMADSILRGTSIATDGGATGIQILPVDVFGGGAGTSTFDVANGIYLAAQGGAKIINLSLGSEGNSTLLERVVRDATSQGIVLVAAAGNTPTTTPTYPAAYPEVVAVTAGNNRGTIASYANRGDFVDVVAPGTSVVTYNGKTYYVSGTSPASAYISGLAAGLADKTGKPPREVATGIESTMAPAATPKP